MRGRKPKPTKLHLIQGTYRPDRAPENPPQPAPIAPKCPPGLDVEAQKIWDSLAPRLERLGLLAETDGHMFALLCEAGARYGRARYRLQDVLRHSAAVSFEAVNLIRKAELSVERAEHSFRLLAAEFGLSPAARARLNVPTGPEDDEFEDFLNRRPGTGT